MQQAENIQHESLPTLYIHGRILSKPAIAQTAWSSGNATNPRTFNWQKIMFPARLSTRVSVEIYWPLKQRPTKFSKQVINEDIIQTSLCACATAQSLRLSKCQATKQVDLTINGRSKAMASGHLTVSPFSNCREQSRRIELECNISVTL